MGWKKPKWVKDIQKEAQNLADALDPRQIAEQAQAHANMLAVTYRDEHDGGGDFDDCVVVVAAGCAAAGATIGASGGPLSAGVGAALGAGTGVPLARIACRRVFPE